MISMKWFLKLIADDFDPVAVWVFDKRNVFHGAVFGALLVGDVILVKPCNGGIKVRYAEADVAEALWLFITIVVVCVRVVFGAPVVGQLKDASLLGNPVFALILVFRGLLVRCQAG